MPSGQSGGVYGETSIFAWLISIATRQASSGIPASGFHMLVFRLAPMAKSMLAA